MFHVKQFQMIRTEKLNVSLKIFKNASAFLQLRAGCNVYSSLRGRDPSEALLFIAVLYSR